MGLSLVVSGRYFPRAELQSAGSRVVAHGAYLPWVLDKWISESRSVVSNSLWPHGRYSPWNSPVQNTGVGSHSLLQGIFPTQDWVQVSCISGRFLTSWATREAQEYWSGEPIPSPVDLPNPGIEPGSPAFRWILYQLSYQGSFHLPCVMWNLPWPGIKPVSPPLVGRLLVTGPPGKSQGQTLNHFPELM